MLRNVDVSACDIDNVMDREEATRFFDTDDKINNGGNKFDEYLLNLKRKPSSKANRKLWNTRYTSPEHFSATLYHYTS